MPRESIDAHAVVRAIEENTRAINNLTKAVGKIGPTTVVNNLSEPEASTNQE